MGSSLRDGNEFTEAQRLTLLVRDSSYCGRADLTQWLFRRLFQPIRQEEQEGFIVYNVSGATNNDTTDYILTPRTRVLTIAQEYRLVFLVDLSSSLATFDPASGQVILSQVYDTLADILQSLIDVPVHTPTIRISVIAECSQFGSNMNVIPILAEYPTLRTFVQNVKLTKTNISATLRIIRSALDKFQRDLGNFRHSMAQRRAKMGYELQVRGEHPAVDSDGTGEDVENSMTSREFPVLMDENKNRKLSKIQQLDHGKGSSSKDTTSNTRSHTQREHRHRRHTNTANANSQTLQSSSKMTTNNIKKDIWGVGTTGSELSYVLQAGLFALNLLPATGQGSIIFLTDGVVKSSVKDESLIRHVSAKDVSCTIVQLGLSEKSFDQHNYGFIPDSEILQFVAKATGGQFFRVNELEQTMARYKRSGRNLFHEKILARDISFIKSITDNNRQRRSKQIDSELGDPLSGHQRFVAQAQSDAIESNTDIESIAMETRLLRYQKYQVIQPVWYFIAARIRQGFVTSSISFESKRIRRSGLSEEDNVNNSKERVTITLVLQWQPSIFIEYRVRGVLSPQWSLYIKSIRSSLQYSIHPASETTSWLLGSLVSTKVEILIRANNTLSHMLQNWDAFQRRCQVMGIVTGAIGDLSRSPGFLKIGKLKRLLARILETDHFLYPLLTLGANREANDGLNWEQYTQRFHSAWSKLNTLETRLQATAWYDIHYIDLIVSYPPKRYSNSQLIVPWSLEEEIQHQHDGIEYVAQCLSVWADIDDDSVFFKFLHDDKNKRLHNRSHICFCEVRISQHTDCTVEIQVHFFNADSKTRQHVMNDLQKCLTTYESMPNSSPEAMSAAEAIDSMAHTGNLHLMLAKRPISRLLMRDPEHNFWEKSGSDSIKTCLTDYAVILASEHIVHNYLRCETWHWELEGAIYDSFVYNGLPTLQDTVFESLRRTRLGQGFVLLSTIPTRCHFYKEYPNYSVQYYLQRDITGCKVVTECWIEPVVDSLAEGHQDDSTEQDLILATVGEADKHIVTELVTFDRICGDILEPKGFDLNARKRSYVSSNGPQQQHPHNGISSIHHIRPFELFDINALLSTNTHQWTMYPLPRHRHTSSDFDYLSWVHLSCGRHEFNTRSQLNTEDQCNEHLLETPMKESKDDTDCICPRPDATFLHVRKAITELPPKERTIIYLHYYFEKCLATLADTVIALDNAPSVSVWQTILSAVDASDVCSIDSTLSRFSRSLQDLQCFVKVFNASVFLLIFVPSLEALVKYTQDTSTENVSPSHLGILILECHRRLSTSTITAANDDAEKEKVTIQLLDEQTTRQYLNDLGCPIFPNIGTSSLNGHGHPLLPLSDYRIRLMQDVSHIYARCFAKSVYISLLYGDSVEYSDYAKVLEICERTTMTIDLTSYVNLQILLRRNCCFSQEDVNDAYLRCLSILECYFQPLSLGSENNEQKIYCYRPPHSDLDQACPGCRHRVSDAADIAVCAHTPLFLRLDYVSEIPSTKVKDARTSVSFPFNDLPTTFYQWDGQDIREYKVDSIGSEKSPVESVDNARLMLRMTLMTLPRSRLDPIDISLTHNQGCSSYSAAHHESFMLDIEPEDEEMLSTVTQEKMEAVCEIKARISWLLTEELMHGLLRAGPITESVIRFVESQLVKKNPFVDFPTTMFIPLDFVKDRAKSRQIFLEQLTSARTVPYRLVRVGDLFYATDNQIFDHETADDLKVGREQENIDDDQVDTTAAYNQDQQQGREQETGNDDFCQGLGISILEPEAPSENTPNIVDTRQQEYWLLIIPRSHSVQIYFYSKLIQSVNRTEIIRETKSMVNDAMERTNKLVLLHYLHETRICSKYLIPPDDSMDTYQSSSEEYSEEEYDDSTHSGDNLVEILSTSGEDASISPPKKFTAGQFACDVVYTRHYPLHWRLPPFSALGVLSNDVLRHFMVKNRPNTFVYMCDDKVLYCTLREEVVAYPEHESRESGVDFASSASRASPPIFPHSDLDLHPRGSVVSSATPSSPHGSHMSDAGSSGKHEYGSYPARKSRSYEARELRLEVHGVDLPDWICQELADLLENRLTLQITLKEVQQFLARNPTSKLSRADIEFLMPTDKTPNEHATFHIPNIVLVDTHHFQHLLRENILLRPLRVLNGSSLNSILRSYKLRRYGILSNPFAPPTGCDDLCFYYSCISKNPGTCTEFEMTAGQGLASIMLSFIGDNWISKPSTDVDSSGRFAGIEWTNKLSKLPLTDDNFITASTDQDALSLDLAIWTIGQIDFAYLKSYVQECVRQSVCDFIIDKTVARLVEAALHDNLMFVNSEATTSSMPDAAVTSLLRALEIFSEWSNSAVEKLDQPADLYPWCLPDILTHADNEISMLVPALRSMMLSDNEQEENKNESNKQTLFLSDTFQDGDIDTYIFDRVESVSSSGNGDERHRREASMPSWTEDTSAYSRYNSLSGGLSLATDPKARAAYKEVLHRQSFLIVSVSTAGCKAYTYNFVTEVAQIALQTIQSIASRQDLRCRALRNIMNQKMGLFHHHESLNNIVSSDHDQLAHGSAALEYTPRTPIMLPRIHHLASKSHSRSQSEQGTLQEEKSKSKVTPSAFRRLMSDNPALQQDSGSTSSFDMDKVQSRISADLVAMDPILTAANLSHEKSVLRYAYTSPVVQEEDKDCLQRHSEPFLATHLRRSELKAAHDKAFKVYTKWAERYSIMLRDPDQNPEEMMPVAELRLILKASRLLHFCRTPLTFSETSAMKKQEDNRDSSITEAWYKNLADTFMREYSAYLESAGMRLIVYGPSNDDAEENEAYLSQFRIAKDAVVSSPVIYLLQVFEGGTIMCEARLTDTFVFVTLYTLHRRYGRLAPLLSASSKSDQENDGQRLKFKEFTNECDRFKQRIHVNSFVFDFHIRFIQRSLDNIGSLPPSVDILAIIRTLLTSQNPPASYSRNRILHGYYQMDAEYPADLLSFVIRNGQRLGLQAIHLHGHRVACFVSSSRASFEEESDDPNASFRYTLVIAPPYNVEDTTAELRTYESQDQYLAVNRLVSHEKASGNSSSNSSNTFLQYYILVSCHFTERKKRTWSIAKPYSSKRLLDPLDEKIGGTTLRRIAEQAVQKIESLTSKAVYLFERDKDWSALYQAVNGRKIEENGEPWARLAKSFYRTDVRELSPMFKQLLDLKVDWNDALSTLRQFFVGISGDIIQKGVSRHVLIFVPDTSLDTFLHFELDLQQASSISVYLNGKDTKYQVDTLNSSQQRCIKEVVLALNYYIWKKTLE